jgi:hypothetical protein
MAGEANHGGPVNLRIHRGAAFPWRMLSRHACDSEITTGCRISCPVPAGGARAGRCARRRGPSRSSVAAIAAYRSEGAMIPVS